MESLETKYERALLILQGEFERYNNEELNQLLGKAFKYLYESKYKELRETVNGLESEIEDMYISYEVQKAFKDMKFLNMTFR